MPECGKLVFVQVGKVKRFRIVSGKKEIDFDYAQLSKALQEAPQESLHNRQVEFSRIKGGKVVRITELGVPWEPVKTPVAEANGQQANHQVTQVTPSFKIDNNVELNNRIDICEKVTALGAPVEKASGKWRRTDYYCENPRCYPYNFARAPRAISLKFLPVPKDSVKPRERQGRVADFFERFPHLDHGRYAPETHTGLIEVELTVLSPLIVSNPPGNDSVLSEQERNAIDRVYLSARTDQTFGPTEIDGKQDKPLTRDEKMQRIRPPFQRGGDRYVLPATALKGMIRSMVEAYSNSFMGVVSESLKGLTDEGKARIWSRTGARWSRPGTGISRVEDVTLYTYRWTGTTWDRWVPKGLTPHDKLAHLNPEANPSRLTIADAMFGRVFRGSDGSKSPPVIQALRGRIRVSDADGWGGNGKPTARAAGSYWFLRPLTRPSGAKAKCEALYLMPDGSGQVAKYGDYTSVARGRKMYWCHSLGGPDQTGARSLEWMRDKIARAASLEDLWSDPEVTKAIEAFHSRVKGEKHSQPSTKSWLKPLFPGSRFRFTIRFEHLTDAELGALLKAIELENIPQQPVKHCHRLGRAKPLGFGSVFLRIERVRLWDMEAAYVALEPADRCWQKAEKVEPILAQARNSFDTFSAPWKKDVWEDIRHLTTIPDKLTDMDYWKNWSDYQPWQNSSHPLPLPDKARP
mgnify:FL=1